MQQKSQVLLSTAYLPPVQYISKFVLYDKVYLEKHENYQKQSYRNRCIIYGANGPQHLVIPVLKTHGEKTIITNVEIDYTRSWQKNHRKAIESAYRLSPYFEFYEDVLSVFYKNKYRYLFDFNQEIMKWILTALDMKKTPEASTSYEFSTSYHDFRQSIHPKSRMHIADDYFRAVPYQQVFGERFGFLANLSIIDLLFNEGPHSLRIIEESTGQKKGGKFPPLFTSKL